MSCEPYPEGEGFHLHLFIQYPNQRSFFSVLKELEQMKKKFVAPKPPGQRGDWGRVQLDPMRGRFDQAHAYLQGDTKDKPLGEVLGGKEKPCWRRKRYIKRIGGPTESFCGRCGSANCLGCCPGCIVCDEGLSLAYDWWLYNRFTQMEFGGPPSNAELQEIKKNLGL
jgi:hypothetical protein